jgi:putative ABC transport system ATP-binding protein
MNPPPQVVRRAVPPAVAASGGLPLALRDVEVAFAESRRTPRVVLDIPSLEIPAGGQVAVCGPSGSGKTTLLHVLAGIERARRGSIRWGAVDVGAMSPRNADRWRRDTLGLVFQQFHLFPGMSALANVLLPLRFDRLVVDAQSRARARALLEAVGVPANARVERMSRGEMQRVAVARALVKAPAIVLADEPTASLDRITAGVVADLLCRLCRERHATLVLVTHDLALAARLDRQLTLASHRLARSDALAAASP